MGLGDGGHNLGEEPEYPGKEEREQNFRTLTFSICEVGCHSRLGGDRRKADTDENHPSQRPFSRPQVTVCGELTNALD